MLIESPRHTRADLEHWARQERYDLVIGRSDRLKRLARKSIRAIEAFGTRDVYASVSWGKDSVVMADLLAKSAVAQDIPLIWVRTVPWDNPDCPHVRDAFLRRHPHMLGNYHEIATPSTSRRWWQDRGGWNDTERGTKGGFTIAAQRFGHRHISGVRAEESRVRSIAQSRWGDATPNTCRPIGWWTAVDVFAHLAVEGLPVHPAYAQSFGGHRDRQWLRVSSIGGMRGIEHGRIEWEETYYPEICSPEAGPRRMHP